MTEARDDQEIFVGIEEEEHLADSDDYNDIPPEDIVAFNELRSCADLLRMYNAKQLTIDPDFQRDIVWSDAAQTRFVDSLMKQLPIPSICLSLDYKTNQRLMIDGLQRISAIIRFLSVPTWRLSKLDDINPEISNKLVGNIKTEHAEMYSRLENITIPVTVLRCDYSKKSHMEYLFTIFHRLNTGGNKLNNQEIRNCIYSGKLNDTLKELVREQTFRTLMDIRTGKKYRFQHEELLLRFWAFLENLEDYKGGLSKFLNDYMCEHRNCDDAWLLKRKELSQRTFKLLLQSILDNSALPKLSKATMESIFIGIAANIEALECETPAQLKERYNTLRNDALFSKESLSEGLSAADKVKGRIGKALEIFS